MGFEYIYAYQENLQWALGIGLTVSVAFLIAMTIVRMRNDFDKDDWIYLMGGGGIVFLFFLFLTLSPDMEHIKQVRDELNNNKPKPMESKNEVLLYPSSSCNSVSLCP